MKYIRTKDGIFDIQHANSVYEYFIKNHTLFCTNHFLLADYGKLATTNLGQILKEADTTEELCDAYWWENTDYNEPIFMPNYLRVQERLNAWKKSDKELNENCLSKITVYGSIYIKGVGWKHVAKINEKGELELL